MKNFAKIIFLLLFVVINSNCNKDIEYVSFESASIGLDNNVGVISIYVKLKNPNSYAIHIVDTEVDIYMNGTSLGLIKNSHDIKIPSKVISVVEIPIRIDLLDLVINIPNIYKLFKAKEVTFKVEGKIVAKTPLSNKEFFISEEQKVSIK